jgi:transcriptional regulator with XRE-family HTH domain
VSSASRYELDIQRLTGALDAVMRHRGLSDRKAAEEIGISPSTITRMSQGKKPDADALVSLLAWLQADAVLFMRPRQD